MRMIVVEKQRPGTDDYVVEGDMPLTEASCNEIAKANGYLTPMQVALVFANGEPCPIHGGPAHRQRRYYLGAFK